MNKRNRRYFEMYLKVREFYNARRADFPSETAGGGLFAALLDTIAGLETLDAATLSITGDVAQKLDVTRAAKTRVVRMLASISDIAEAMSAEFDGIERRFRVPRNRGVPQTIALGRAFAADARVYRDDFVRYGMDAHFVDELTVATDALDALNRQTSDGTQHRVGRNASFAPLIRRGGEIVRRLGPVVRLKYAGDAANLSAWEYASHLSREPEPAKSRESRVESREPAEPAADPAV
ncbi:MAG: hypothetical protein JSS81_08535 [Acidobacteria bacterium]|nr:hypothetical protein [Acidobacteriota bacterium]